MSGKIGRTGGKAVIPAVVLACLFDGAFGAALAEPASSLPWLTGEFAPHMMWEVVIGGVVAGAFLAALVLWVASALRQVRHQQQRRNIFVGSALNHLGQGIVMLDAQKRLVFCNDRYLEIYGLSRAAALASLHP